MISWTHDDDAIWLPADPDTSDDGLVICPAAILREWGALLMTAPRHEGADAWSGRRHILLWTYPSFVGRN
jgi:hypothetical protein